MKNLFTFSVLFLVGTIAFGQKMQNDPSYSVHNYKHPNKAAIAKKNKKEDSEVFSGTAKRNDNYKHQVSRKEASTDKVVVKTAKRDPKNRSYKHPYGL